MMGIRIFDSFNITVDIDYDSFAGFGITKGLYEPQINKALNVLESNISEGSVDVAAGILKEYVWTCCIPTLG